MPKVETYSNSHTKTANTIFFSKKQGKPQYGSSNKYFSLLKETPHLAFLCSNSTSPWSSTIQMGDNICMILMTWNSFVMCMLLACLRTSFQPYLMMKRKHHQGREDISKEFEQLRYCTISVSLEIRYWSFLPSNKTDKITALKFNHIKQKGENFFLCSKNNYYKEFSPLLFS